MPPNQNCRTQAPAKDEAPAAHAARGAKDPVHEEQRQSRHAPGAKQALQAIEGERKATDYLARLHARQAPSDDLAVTVSMLYGAALRGFCRVLEKALQEVPHG